MKAYHIGMSKQGKTLVIEARRDIDYLSCELYDYYGLRETTKARLYADRYKILSALQGQKPHVYGDLRYAVVS